MRPHDRMLHDDAFRKGNAGKRPKLRIAALNQLTEPRRYEPRRDSTGLRRLKLAGVTRERPPLRLVVIADVDNE